MKVLVVGLLAGLLSAAGSLSSRATDTLARVDAISQSSELTSGSGIVSKRLWNADYLESLSGATRGEPITIELTEDSFVTGIVQRIEYRAGEVCLVGGILNTPADGRFFFQKQSAPGVAGDFFGVVEMPGSQKAFRIEPSGLGGRPELVERRLEEVVCVGFKRPRTTGPQPGAKDPPLDPADYPNLPIPPYQNGILPLESLHGAAPVVYLDFQGGYTPTWGGITYARPDVNNAQIREVWQRVAEDFMPFNINVTTDLQVYERAAPGARQRVLITPTAQAAGDVSGVAYLGTFNATEEVPCWSFVVSGNSCASVCSHEIGHTLGLTHEGQDVEGTVYEYYGGQGDGDTGWAPIMGSPYGKNVTQWCRGEYLYGNNQQDQLVLITSQNNGVSYRPDDTGDTLATSRYLELYSNYSARAEDVIERTADTDAFQFTTSGGDLALRADPVSLSPNLAIEVSLYDANDALVATSNPHDTLWASIATNLPAGAYTFRVTGAGRNDPLTNGFSSYASLGYYSVSGWVTNARLPDRFDLPEHATNGTIVGVVAAQTPSSDPLAYSIVSGNTANTFSLDNWGTLRVADNRLLDYATLASKTQLPVQFELFVDIVDTLNSSLSETNRRVVVAILLNQVPPTITQQPQDVTVPAGSEASFAVGIAGTPPFVYQWFFNGAPIDGALSPYLLLTNVQATNIGEYQLRVTNLLGADTSAPAHLAVNPAPPLITLEPVSQAAFLGLGAGFQVAAAGTEPFTYQWQLNGMDVAGATNNIFFITNVTSGDGGRYHAIVSSAAGSTTSSDALLSLVPLAAWGWNANGQTNLPLELTNAVQVSAGSTYNLALRRDGSVIAWGDATQTNVPAGLTNAKAIAAGGAHSLALRTDGTVAAWGNNYYGQLAVPSGLSNVVAIAAGGNHSLALRSDGSVVGWGLASNGQAIVPLGVTNIVAIAAGNTHSLALGADGTVFAWGDNSFGQAQVRTNATNVVAIAAGANHSLALRMDGTVTAWGQYTYFQSAVPLGTSNVIAVAGGAFDSLALKSDATLAAWGAGTGLSGYPYVGQSIIPPTVTNVTAISGGTANTLVLTGDGAPFISEPPVSRYGYKDGRVVFRAMATGALPLSFQWQFNGADIDSATNRLLILTNLVDENSGTYRVLISNAYGLAVSDEAQLVVVSQPPFVVIQPSSQTGYIGGNATLRVVAGGSGPLAFQWRFNGRDIPYATNATLILDRLQLSSAGGYSVVVSNSAGAVTSSKAQLQVAQVVAWGLGTNPSFPNLGQANVPAGLLGVVRVAGGLYHSLALRNDGTVLAWGANSLDDYGQAHVPAGLRDVVDIAAGGYHSLALKADGSVVAWGAGSSNAPGQIQRGQSMVPPALANVVGIAAGDYHSVALTWDGQVVVWGADIAGFTVTNVPAAATNIVAIASQGSDVIALRADGKLFMWGIFVGTQSSMVPNAVAVGSIVNQGLILRSDGLVTPFPNGTPLPGFSNIIQIAGAASHWLAIKDDGTVMTWGNVGTGDLARIPPGISSAIDVAGGQYHSLVALGDGAVVLKVPLADRAAALGSQMFFNAMAAGARPLSYQWQFNGALLPGVTNAWLRLTNLKASDAGNYCVMVSNGFGAVTSRVAALSLFVPVSNALDAPGLNWMVNGNAAWFTETEVAHDGISAAQSGAIGDSQQCSIQTTVNGPGILSFWWKISSEQGFDFLSFSVDGVKQAAISGNVDWQQETFPILGGTQTLTWTYAKDSSVSAGLDAGWLDEVTFVTNGPIITMQPGGQTVFMGEDFALNVAAYGAPPLSYQWLKNGTNLGQPPLPTLQILKATRRDSGEYAVAVSNPGGSILSSNAVVRVRVPQQLQDPEWSASGGFSLLSRDADGGVLLQQDLSGFEAQTSTNLVDWTPLTNTLILTNGSLLIPDPDATNAAKKFYRILER